MAPVSRRTILVVDDEATVRDLLCDLLESLGHDCLPASTGDEAVALFTGRGDDVGVVLLDLHLEGDLTGPATYRRLQAMDPDVRIVCMSGDRQDPELGVLPDCPCLEKPFRAQELADVLRRALDARD